MLDAKEQKKVSERSLGSLWRNSPVWRYGLIATSVFTIGLVVYPPWDWYQNTTNQNSAGLSAKPGNVASSSLPLDHTTPSSGTSALPTNPLLASTSPGKPMAPSVPAVPMQQLAKSHHYPMIPTTHDEASKAAMTSALVEEDQQCGNGGPMNVAINPPPPVPARVVGFVSPAVVPEGIRYSERAANGKIDPDYVSNLRVNVHPLLAPPGKVVTVVVPKGTNVFPGEKVEMIGGHASPILACHYVPNLLIAPTKGKQ